MSPEFARKYREALEAIGGSDRYLAEVEATRFRATYPDSPEVIRARRDALNREASALHAPGRRTERRRAA